MKFYKYTPALLDPKTLEETLIGRDLELDNLKRILKNASSGKSFSHAILIGPKGIGKTHILRVLYHCIKGDIKTKGINTFKNKFVPVIFSEEEYPGNITKLIMLSLRYLDESKLEGVPQIPKELMDAVSLKEKEKELAFSYIKTFKKKTGKILLLLIDNLNDIIERFTDEDQSSLREALMTYDSVLLIGAAPTLFDSIINHDRPFYNFFEIIWLKDLSFEDSTALLNQYAKLEGRNDVIEKLKRSESKLRAIYELAGGNPRLILSLYHIAVEGDITFVENTFLKILDELSSYFRERMKDLSAQQSEIIDIVARAEKLLTPTEISALCHMPVNIVNSQLKRMEKIGYVKKYAEKPKRVLYDLNEKLFSLWRQMRVEAGRKRLGFIVRFLEIWFTKEELFTHLDKTLGSIREKLPLDNAEFQHDMDKLWYLKEAIPEFKGDDEICVTCERENYNLALELIKKALKRKPKDVNRLYQLGCIYRKLERYDEAIDTYKKSIELEPDKYMVWYHLGNTYVNSKKFDEAIDAYKKSIELEPDNHEAWNNLGNAYKELKRYDKAVEAYKKSLEIKPDSWSTWYSIGCIYLYLKRYEEAIEACKKSVEIQPDDNGAWNVLGASYLGLQKLDDALETFKRAIKIKDCKHCTQRAWLGLGIVYIYKFINSGIKNELNSSINNLKESLNCLSFMPDKNEIFDGYMAAFKDIIKAKKVDLIKAALKEIKMANQPWLLKFLSPYATLIKYLETKDKEIIDRLRHEERIVVEDMLRMLGETSNEKARISNLKGKIGK